MNMFVIKFIYNIFVFDGTYKLQDNLCREPAAYRICRNNIEAVRHRVLQQYACDYRNVLEVRRFEKIDPHGGMLISGAGCHELSISTDRIAGCVLLLGAVNS